MPGASHEQSRTQSLPSVARGKTGDRKDKQIDPKVIDAAKKQRGSRNRVTAGAFKEYDQKESSQEITFEQRPGRYLGGNIV